YAVEAKFGELLPQPVAEAVLAIDIAPVAQLLRDRAFLGHEALRGVAQHRLVVGEIEGHRIRLPEGRGCAWRRCRAGSRWCRPRSNWPWCGATRGHSCRDVIGRCPIPAHRSRGRP